MSPGATSLVSIVEGAFYVSSFASGINSLGIIPLGERLLFKLPKISGQIRYK